MKKFLAVAAISTVCVGCGSGGGDGSGGSSCDFVGGSGNWVSTGGSASNTDAVADGNLNTFALFDPGPAAGSFIDAQRGSTGSQFPGGGNAGVFLTPPGSLSDTDVTISTFIDQPSATVESATGSLLTITPTTGDAATDYVSFMTTAPYNGVKLTINTPKGSYLVYEFCGSATVR